MTLTAVTHTPVILCAHYATTSRTDAPHLVHTHHACQPSEGAFRLTSVGQMCFKRSNKSRWHRGYLHLAGKQPAPWPFSYERRDSEGSGRCRRALLQRIPDNTFLLQTKKLWIDRLQREKKSREKSALPVPVAKPPNRLSISYPFSSSPLLQEQVLPSHAGLIP